MCLEALMAAVVVLAHCIPRHQLSSANTVISLYSQVLLPSITVSLNCLCYHPLLLIDESNCHAVNCEKIRTGGAKEKKEDEGMYTRFIFMYTSFVNLSYPNIGSQGSDSASKKRKADSSGGPEGGPEPQSKKKKTLKVAKASGLPGGKGSRTKGMVFGLSSLVPLVSRTD